MCLLWNKVKYSEPLHKHPLVSELEHYTLLSLSMTHPNSQLLAIGIESVGQILTTKQLFFFFLQAKLLLLTTRLWVLLIYFVVVVFHYMWNCLFLGCRRFQLIRTVVTENTHPAPSWRCLVSQILYYCPGELDKPCLFCKMGVLWEMRSLSWQLKAFYFFSRRHQ